MAKTKPQRDPRGHSLRVYADVYDSPAFAALSPHDVLAYLALLRELKGYNNGDLSLTLTRAKLHGISHHLTLARSLRALCAVGLVAITRKGGCTKGGQRQPTLYRLTDRECYEIPAKMLQALKETHEWKRITSVEQARQLIEAAEQAAKKGGEKKDLGHAVTATRTPRDMVNAKTRTPRDTWNAGPGHRVTMAGSTENPTVTGAYEGFRADAEKSIHRTPHVPPLYVYQSVGQSKPAQGHGNYARLTRSHAHLFTGALQRQPHHPL